MHNVSIISSDFSESSFSSVKHDGLRIESSSLKSASFRNTPLASVSLASSDISGIILSENLSELKGAKLDVSQALDIAKLLGIEIF